MIETAEPDDDSFCFARVSPKMNHDYQPGPFHTVVTIEGLGFDWQRGGGGPVIALQEYFGPGGLAFLRGGTPPPREKMPVFHM